MSEPSPAAPRRRLVVILVLVGALVAAAAVVGLAVTTDAFRCPPGQSWVDQGDSPPAYRGCVGNGQAVKPIVYLYPTAPTRVTVKLSHPENLTAQYPTYGQGWTVLARPDGTLHEDSSGRELYALYYESANRVAPTVREDGFVVAGGEVAGFLEETLPRLGLGPREAQEFIVYWLPILQGHPYVYLRFADAAEIEANQHLTITPRPDTLIRVMMTWKPLDAPIPLTPQALPPVTRTGFTVVEWGGTEIP